ncbi:MAG: hypothetical protein ACP5QR_01945 [Rhizomicrobium sp.]
MARFGVGVGEDFPMDDRLPPGAGPDGPEPGYSYRDWGWYAREWYAFKAAHRAAKARWRAARAQFRAERKVRQAQYWSEQARSFGYGPGPGAPPYDLPPTGPQGYGYGRVGYGRFGLVRPYLILGIVIALALSGLIRLLAALPVLLFGLIVAVVLWFTHHRRGQAGFYPPPSPPSRF